MHNYNWGKLGDITPLLQEITRNLYYSQKDQVAAHKLDVSSTHRMNGAPIHPRKRDS
jgi:hypothetical protein